MNESLLLALVLLLLVVSVAALVAGLVALRRTSRGSRRSRLQAADLPTDLDGLRSEVRMLRAEAADALRHLAVVRYDAFGDMGGRLSWSLALLDDGGGGVVLTSIHGRSEARTYAKSISAWSCEQAMSPEEEDAVKLAKSAVTAQAA